MKNKNIIAALVLSALFALIIICQSASAATVYGRIYDENLNRTSRVLVFIDSKPEQVMLSEDGNYSFSVPIGEYKINALYVLGLAEYTAEEYINITEEGEFVRDIFLLPVLKEEDIEKQAIELTERFVEKGFDYAALAVVALWIVFLIITIKFFVERKKREEIEAEEAEMKQYDEFMHEGSREAKAKNKRNSGRPGKKEIK